MEHSRDSLALRRWPLAFVLASALSLTVPAAPLHAQQDTFDVSGQWDGTLQVTQGPGAGLTDSCTTTVAQDGVNLTGGGACNAAGSGSCTGSVLPVLAQMHLVCVSPLQGNRTILATISEDGSTASGTWTASNGSSGSYLATRDQAPADPTDDADPGSP